MGKGKDDPRMSASARHEFITTELDPDLLSTSFGVQTNWHVITGVACSGKTTLIKQLAAKGFPTVPEIGRVYVEREMSKGRTMDEILEGGNVVQRAMLAMQRSFERRLGVNVTAFLDRGAPDFLTYCRLLGLNPNEVLAGCFHHRYASIFILDRFPFEGDGVRIEDDTTADLMDEWFARDYGALGYDVVRVPVLPREERLAFVLERLSEQGAMNGRSSSSSFPGN
jgi:predicted ATPase